jgi:hypothetical protein
MDLKFKKIKFKYSYIVKISYGLIVITFFGLSYWLSNFLYKNFYQVVTHAKAITVLRKEVAAEIVDAAKFEKVLNHLNEKQKKLPFEVKEVPNIFSSSRRQSTVTNDSSEENIVQPIPEPTPTPPNHLDAEK